MHFNAEDPFRFVERVTAADKARTEAELKLVCTYTPQNFLFNLVSSCSICMICLNASEIIMSFTADLQMLFTNLLVLVLLARVVAEISPLCGEHASG